MNDLMQFEGVLSAADLAQVRAGLALAEAAASTVLSAAPGGVVRPLARRSQRLAPGAEVEALLRQRLEALRPVLAAHFGQALGTLEPLQVLRYRPGDFFVAHEDGNTPLVHDASRHRRVSISLLLSAPGDYTGGDLVFHSRDFDKAAVPVPAGGVVAFRSETTHEVLPLETGERLSVAAWFRAAGTD
jgi:SM-20-related protein